MGTASAPTTLRKHHHAGSSHLIVEDSANCVLIVSSSTQDRQALEQVLGSHARPRHWTSTVREAAEWLSTNRARVVICDDHLPDGHWQELWEHVRRRPDPTVFIVSAAWTDARLWAEVLNLGAYDVLVKPYQQSEVSRILQHAWRTFEHFA
jgi:DNA-binding NtrC family response regulator